MNIHLPAIFKHFGVHRGINQVLTATWHGAHGGIPESLRRELEPFSSHTFDASSTASGPGFNRSVGSIVVMITLWLCQNSHWTWPFIVGFPMKNGDFP